MFVFDTSSLLSFYELSTKSQENIFATTFTKIKNRLWIPGHVEFEYLKNRKNVITNIYNDKYKKLNEQHFNQITKHIGDINSIVDDLSNKTKKQDAHPYIDTLIVNDFRNSCNVFKENYNLFKEKFDKEISKIKEEIDDKLNHDNVLNEFNKSFDVGKDFAYTQIMEIVKEGELRYRNQIPPGYEDSENKVGFQKYGDLIIWKQIISFAKETKKSIVFIVNDTKEDWCYKCKRSNENRIERPREELIKEIKDEANVDFWMYTLSQFLYSADILLKTKINKSAIEEVEIVEQYQQKSTINRKDNYFGEIRKGDIYYADLSPVVGSELGGIRPIVIIQNNFGNKYSPTVIVAGITSQINKAKLTTQVEISLEAYGLNKKSVVLLEQMRTLDKGRLKEKIGHLNDDDMKKINKALLIEVGL